VRVYPRPDWPFKIIEEPAVTEAIVAARELWPRFEEIWDGVVWLIAHGGDRLDAEERVIGGVGHFIYAYEGDPAAGFPRIVVAYKWALGNYTLRWLLVSSPE
jgi:hypothetical protein